MAAFSISQRADGQSVEALFDAYLGATAKTAGARLAKQIGLELRKRIAARKIELEQDPSRPASQPREIPSARSFRRENAYAAG